MCIETILTALTDTDPRIAKDYAYYKADARTQALQADYDLSRSIDDAPAKDFAWAKTVERARNRNRPTWDQEKALFLANLSAQKYAQAIA